MKWYCTECSRRTQALLYRAQNTQQARTIPGSAKAMVHCNSAPHATRSGAAYKLYRAAHCGPAAFNRLADSCRRSNSVSLMWHDRDVLLQVQKTARVA